METWTRLLFEPTTNSTMRNLALALFLIGSCTYLPEGVLTSTLDTEGGPLLDVDRGAAGLWQQLQKLSTTASLLHTVAHPDDEHAGMLTYMSRGLGVRTALLSINRGEAGANAIGSELFDGLGLIRTEELRLASRYYGLDDLYFSATLDYGYSKTLEESLRSWDTDKVLEDMVRVIRMNRPLVIVSRFHGSLRDGHGNHVAMGIMTPDAYVAAADSTRFPEQITEEGLRPWKAKKLYRGGVRESEPWHVHLDTGMHSPWLGHSYYNFGTYGLSLQRSQTSGRTRDRMGPVPYYYERMDGLGPDVEADYFSGLDVTLGGLFDVAGETASAEHLALLNEVAAHVQNAMDTMHPGNPAAVSGDLVQGLDKTRQILEDLDEESEAYFMLAIKEAQFQHAIMTALGLRLTAIAMPEGATPQESPWLPPVTMGPLVRGQSFVVDVQFENPSDVPVTDVDFAVLDPDGDDWGASEKETVSESPFHHVRFTPTVPDDAPYSRPYFARDDIRQNHYDILDPRWNHLPARPASLQALVEYHVDDVPLFALAHVKTREADLPYGHRLRKTLVMPAVAVNIAPAQRIVIPQEGGSAFTVSVELINHVIGGTSGTLTLEIPEGWSTDPGSHDLVFQHAGERQAVTFEVFAGELAGDAYTLRAIAHVAEDSVSEGYRVIRHRDIETRYLFRDASMRVRSLAVEMAPDLDVGYIMGVGDEVPSGIMQLGARVTLLGEADLASGNLEQFNVIVIGTRAYAVRQDLITYNRRLIDYAHAGGILIVLYQTQEFVPEQMAPFPAALPRGAEEVSEEDAPVTILAPEHPVIVGPNPITSADFDDWVEQRGSKFFTEWDPAYTPLVETQDTGQAPQRGILLTADVGDGHYTYCALALHRQLPYAVPGAFRLLANLLSM